MDEIRPINFKDIKFTRDTKVDYENGDVVVNSVFSLYDKDHSGDFDDNEWRIYSAVHERLDEQRERVNNSETNTVSKYYQHKAKNLRNEIERFERKYANQTTPNFEKLAEYFEKYGVGIQPVENKEQIPEDFEIYEIENFGMGYSEKYNSSFKYGYIIGLEKFSPGEQKEYLKILNAAVKEMDTKREYEQKHEQMLDEYFAMCDMPDYCALNGITEKMSKKDEKTALQNCQAIRNSIANPAYQAIKDTEEKIKTLHRKHDRTEADTQELNRLYVQLHQLSYASSHWRLHDFNFDMGQYQPNREQFFMPPQFVQVEQQIQIAETNFQIKNTSVNGSDKIGLDEQGQDENKSLNISDNTNISISNNDFKTGKSINSSVTITETNNPFTNENNVQFNGDIRTGRKIGKLNVNTGINLYSSPYSNTFSPSISLSKENYSLNITENLSTNNNQHTVIQAKRPKISEIFEDNRIPEISPLTTSTSISLNYNNFKVLNAGISANLSKARKSFSGNLSKEFSTNTNTISVSTTPSLNAEYAISSYIDGYGVQATSQNVNLTPAITGSITYYDPVLKFGSKLEVNESYAMTFGEHNSFESNNNFTASGYVQYDKLGLGVQYNNSKSPFRIANTLGVTVNYKPSENIYVSAGYNYSNEKFSNNLETNKNILTIGGTILLEPKKKSTQNLP